MEKIIVKLENYSKNYGKREIIKNLNLEVYEGEFLTILGSSGCGKTTILRSIAGLDEVTNGKIFIDNIDVTNMPATKRGVNTLFQNYALFPHMTVEENIGFGLKMKGIDKNTIKKEVESMLKLVRLSGYGKRTIKELSGGEQQRVSIARGLINKPKVLLLDEPISALDLKLKKQMQIELKMLQRKTGITFIYVTHNQDEALTMSNRIVLLNKGKIEQIDTPEHIYHSPISKYAADFIGESTIFDGIINKIDNEYSYVTLDNNSIIKIKNDKDKINDKVSIVFRPEDIKLTNEGKKLQSLPIVIKENIYDGSLIKVIGEAFNKEVKITINKDSKIYPINSSLFMTWDIKDIIVIRNKENER